MNLIYLRKGHRLGVTLPLFFIILCIGLPVLLLSAEAPAANTIPETVTVSFRDTPLAECLETLTRLSGSKATIRIIEGENLRINKTAVNQRWDVILQTILVENNLKLAKLNNEYVIVFNNKNDSPEMTERSADKDKAQVGGFHCENLITFGYQYGAGSNPYDLLGRCIKLNNFKPIRYTGANSAIAMWSYNGESGLVFVEDRSNQKLLNKANSVITQSIGVYQHGKERFIPHLLLQPREQ